MTQSPVPGFLFTLCIVGAVGLTLLFEGRWRKLLFGGIAALLVVGVLGTFGARHHAAHEQVQQFRAANDALLEAQVQFPGGHAGLRVGTVRGGPAPPRRLEVPDDVAAWKRDSTLDFKGGDAWREEDLRTMTRKFMDLGDTRFTYWDPSSSDKLVGLSDKEPTPEAALGGARDAARQKLAALALIKIKNDDPRFDAIAAERLARRLAGREDVQSWREEDAYQEYATRPYGTLYRAAVCVKADDKYIERLQIAVRREVATGALRREQEFRSWIVFTGAALLGGVAIFLLYTLANAGTKGYFAWPLRGAAAAFFVVMLLVAFYHVRGGGRMEFPTEFAPSFQAPQPAPAR